MPDCSICGRLAPVARRVDDVGLVCPASRGDECLEAARERAARKWAAETTATMEAADR
jgi:hypothetical protein